MRRQDLGCGALEEVETPVLAVILAVVRAVAFVVEAAGADTLYHFGGYTSPRAHSISTVSTPARSTGCCVFVCVVVTVSATAVAEAQR
jgi:hypothetical protein